MLVRLYSVLLHYHNAREFLTNSSVHRGLGIARCTTPPRPYCFSFLSSTPLLHRVPGDWSVSAVLSGPVASAPAYKCHGLKVSFVLFFFWAALLPNKDPFRLSIYFFQRVLVTHSLNSYIPSSTRYLSEDLRGHAQSR